MPDLWARLSRAPNRARAASSDFDLNPGVPRPTDPARLKQASVLIGVDADERLILTRRAAHLKYHAGQIAFPGGRRDDDDADAVATAMREAHEEIALPPSTVDVIGEMPPHQTISGYEITPILARVGDFTPCAEPGEVDEIFRVPMAYVTDPARFTEQRRHWHNTDWGYYTVPYGPYYIWGATARILRALSEAMT